MILRFFPRWLLVLVAFPVLLLPVCAADVPSQIDQFIVERAKQAGQPLSPLTSDAEFLRRVFLDFAGRIPTVAEARAFLADSSPKRREQLIDRLIDGPEYGSAMATAMHIALMERLGDHPLWTKYLTTSFAENRPWNQIVREILWQPPDDEKTAGAAFFLAKRLEKIGQNPVDYSGLTRDVGRLFLGKNLGCAECHDHLFIDDYKQAHFQGLHAFFKNSYLVNLNPPQVGEKPTTQKSTFASVFTKIEMMTGPALPGGIMLDVPNFKPGDEYLVPPNPKSKSPGVLKFSPLKAASEQIPMPTNRDFVRNSVNRFWFLLMGRGLVHPLDLSHSRNPASHPELLEFLADQFIEHHFDVKWLMKTLARTDAYQRSSLLPSGVDDAPEKLFTTALERRLSPEQLAASVAIALGEQPSPALTAKFIKAFANQPREPEEEINPSLSGSLFILHDSAILSLLQPKPGNLIDRLQKLADTAKVAEELYLALLSRTPSPEEIAIVAEVLLQRSATDRPQVLANLVWSLLASMEFRVNH